MSMSIRQLTVRWTEPSANNYGNKVNVRGHWWQQRRVFPVLCVCACAVLGLFSNSIYQQYAPKSNRLCSPVLNTKQRVHSSMVVVAGTVVHVTPDPYLPSKIARIRVKRVFKGAEWVSMNDNKETLIHGVSDPAMCHSRVRVGQSWVFLAQAQDRQLTLQSAVISVTLRHLNQLNAWTRGERYTTPKPIIKRPCESITCRFHAVCHERSASNATCECPNLRDVAPSVQRLLYVGSQCGSNDVTYSSLWHLRTRSCQLQQHITVKHSGPCTVDPCVKMECGPGEKCQVNGVTSEATCVCPKKCPSYGDDNDSRTVCGNNGVDYKNVCELNRASCTSKPPREIGVAVTGRCDPCSLIGCPQGTICKLDKNRTPRCRCSEQCDLREDPVCASDGKTYRNECIMKVHSCRMNKPLEVVWKMRCEMAENPCKDRRCEHGQECILKRLNGRTTAMCDCIDLCQAVMRPVCGRDGVTYVNECVMRRDACTKRMHNDVKHNGPCGVGVCAHHVCHNNSVCVEKEGLASCQCPVCETDELKEVCGSNGVTYPNLCRLRQESCRQRTNVYAKYDGFCDGCESMRCDFYSLCVTDGEGNGQCLCPQLSDCTSLDDTERPPQVCGTDGVTYDNECFLEAAACQQNRFIVVAAKGACDACAKVSCPWHGRCKQGVCTCPQSCPQPVPHEQVCASDGKRYKSECFMQSAACEKGMILQIDSDERCASDIFGPEPSNACRCNRLGSYSTECSRSGKCRCRPGVQGARCDHCLPGFWGLHLISDGHQGCQPCACSAFGSERLDCEQSTGRCVCKPNVFGLRCQNCNQTRFMTPNGCMLKAEYSSPKDCEHQTCHHGAQCRMEGGLPTCICPSQCSSLFAPGVYEAIGRHPITVCGTDQVTYDSICELKQFACKFQRDIVPLQLGACPLRMDGGLGSKCVSNSDCKTLFSRCLTEPTMTLRCTCVPNYAQVNQDCVALSAIHPPQLACDSGPCPKGQQCQLDNYSEHGYKCKGSESHIVPRFVGQSYMELETIQAYANVRVTVEFKAETESGILLYNGHSSGEKGDFMSVSLNRGYVELRFNLGNGIVLMQSIEPIRLNRWTLVDVTRTGKRANMKVDNQVIVNSPSEQSGTGQHLNVDEPMYLGGVPAYLAQLAELNSGIGTGLHGCIRRLTINKDVVDLRTEYSNELKSTHLIVSGSCGEDSCMSGPCQNGGLCVTEDNGQFSCDCDQAFTGSQCERVSGVCASNPCINGGTCSALTTDSFYCFCPNGFAGRKCESGHHKRSERAVHLTNRTMQDTVVPEFLGNGYLELQPLSREAEKTSSIEIWFKTDKSSGLLMYTGHSNALTGYDGGDFLALHIHQSTVVFSFNLGAGPTNISSHEKLQLGDWNQVRVSRQGRVGTLTVNNQPQRTITAKEGAEQLNLHSAPLFIGGVKDKRTMPELAGADWMLHGAVQRLLLNGVLIDNIMQASISSRGVGRYTGAPCLPNVCKNGAICIPHLNEHKCICTQPFIGNDCDKKRFEIETRAVRFDGIGGTYMNCIDHKEVSQSNNSLYLSVRTRASNGVLLFANHGLTLRGDYLGLAILDGYVTASFNLGKQTQFTQVKSSVFIADDRWHSVTFDRSGRFGQMAVDDERPVTFISNDGATELNTDGQLCIGGCDSLPMGLPSHYYLAYIGCLRNVHIDGRSLHLHSHNLSPNMNIAYC